MMNPLIFLAPLALLLLSGGSKRSTGGGTTGGGTTGGGTTGGGTTGGGTTGGGTTGGGTTGGGITNPANALPLIGYKDGSSASIRNFQVDAQVFSDFFVNYGPSDAAQPTGKMDSATKEWLLYATSLGLSGMEGSWQDMMQEAYTELKKAVAPSINIEQV
jgi:hypothetical protein